ncbi:hypothetical protein C5167_011939 [Papaver somniferum]|uniref:Uncharacterized protein n=1 Tax=Papaver somniferum TaxID=3469 RepID=A0A4Y7IZZ5_PAPSO|nr:hypothetical protein C5167_011939 [Papaver somniferum]
MLSFVDTHTHVLITCFDLLFRLIASMHCGGSSLFKQGLSSFVSIHLKFSFCFNNNYQHTSTIIQKFKICCQVMEYYHCLFSRVYYLRHAFTMKCYSQLSSTSYQQSCLVYYQICPFPFVRCKKNSGGSIAAKKMWRVYCTLVVGIPILSFQHPWQQYQIGSLDSTKKISTIGKISTQMRCLASTNSTLISQDSVHALFATGSSRTQHPCQGTRFIVRAESLSMGLLFTLPLEFQYTEYLYQQKSMNTNFEANISRPEHFSKRISIMLKQACLFTILKGPGDGKTAFLLTWQSSEEENGSFILGGAGLKKSGRIGTRCSSKDHRNILAQIKLFAVAVVAEEEPSLPVLEREPPILVKDGRSVRLW